MALTDTQVAKAADLLAATFQARTTIDALPEDCLPGNAAEAVQVQIAMLERIDLEAAGYKAGFTNPPMLEKAGPDGPMFGVMFRDFTIGSGGSLKRSDVGPGALIEAEISFRMGADLPARAGDYNDAEVMGAVDSAIIGRVLVKAAVANGLVDSRNVLVDNTASAEAHMADL